MLENRLFSQFSGYAFSKSSLSRHKQRIHNSAKKVVSGINNIERSTASFVGRTISSNPCQNVGLKKMVGFEEKNDMEGGHLKHPADVQKLNFENETSFDEFKKNVITYGKISDFPKLD